MAQDSGDLNEENDNSDYYKEVTATKFDDNADNKQDNNNCDNYCDEGTTATKFDDYGENEEINEEGNNYDNYNETIYENYGREESSGGDGGYGNGSDNDEDDEFVAESQALFPTSFDL